MPKKKSNQSIFSTSCVSSVFMALYVAFAFRNLYGIMYPLTRFDLTTTPPEEFINPLWEKETPLHMNVYLSTRKKVDVTHLQLEFLEGELSDNPDLNESILLWKQSIDSVSLSKSFLITSLDCDEELCGSEEDESTKSAIAWLDEAERQLADEAGGILSTISGAGQGIESTSILLTLYETLTKQVVSLLEKLSLVKSENSIDKDSASNGMLERSKIHLPRDNPMWKALMSNSTLYIHAVLVPQKYSGAKTLTELASKLEEAGRLHFDLFGKVGLVKYDEPNHITKPGRFIYHDLIYLFQKYILGDTHSHAPWEMEHAKPEFYKAYEVARRMKEEKQGYPFFKPEVAIKFLMDEESYPYNLVHLSGMDVRRVPKSPAHPFGRAHRPVLYVDEIGLTSEKYIPINETIASLPLRISFDRSDVIDENTAHRSTVNAGGMSPARWRMLSFFSESLETQKELGFEQSDIDDLRRLIADTNVVLLAITIAASSLHLLFEFLTFKSEVSFWNNNSDLTGLSVRSLFLDMIGQVVVILFLIDQESSLLVTLPSAFGCLIALWKCQRAAGLAFVRVQDKSKPSGWWNVLPRLVGFELRATRLEVEPSSEQIQTKKGKKIQKKAPDAANNQDLQALTIECDRIATRKLSKILLPLVLGYTLYSFIYYEHISWYSWLITSASSAVYALGFALMTPQLFLNYKMKSVAHLPWKVLVYKTLNTFIDDLFSFIIRMPTMARISCFRDDVVFFIYLYQRWLYPVDTSRPSEGFEDAPEVATSNNVTDTKKKQ